MEFSEIIRTAQLTKQRDGIPAVQDITLSISQGKRIGIMGETGSGKSTLLRLIAGLEQPDQGMVYYQGKRVIGPDEQLIAGHPKIACIGQQSALRNNYRVSEFLDFTNLLDEEKSAEVYRICAIGHLLNRWTDELSGGEKQRIYLASLLTTQPTVLLLDEPFSSLDYPHKKMMQQVMANLTAALNLTILWVSHDYTEVLPWADELMIMRSGNVIQAGNPELLYLNPLDEYVAGLMGGYNILQNKNHVRALTGLNDIPADKGLFLRPHQLIINKDENTHLTATIADRLFLGTHFIYKIQLSDEILQVQSGDFLQVGETVGLFAASPHFHFIG